jgi:hypothetical protein
MARTQPRLVAWAIALDTNAVILDAEHSQPVIVLSAVAENTGYARTTRPAVTAEIPVTGEDYDLITESGPVDIAMPRDLDDRFEPK